MIYSILVGNSFKIKNLATGKNCRNYFMLFSCGQNKNCKRWRFFQCFKKCIESRCAQHVYFIYYIYFVSPGLRRKSYLLHEGSYTVSYTHLRAHETDSFLVCPLLLEKKKR